MFNQRSFCARIGIPVTTLMGLGLATVTLLLLGGWAGGTATAAPVPDPVLSQLDATAGITVVTTAPAVVYQAAGAGPTSIQYTLTIQNPDGYGIAAGAVITDEPSTGSISTCDAESSWAAACPSGALVTFTLQNTTTDTSVPVGTFQVAVPVPVQDGSAVVDPATWFTGTVDGTDQAFRETIPVTTTLRAPDFALAETPSVPICAGGRVSYTVVISNPGGVGTTLPFTITGQITSLLDIVSGTISDGGSWTSGAITWPITTPTLQADGGNQVTRTFAATIPPTTSHATPLVNIYTPTSPEVLPNVPVWSSSGVTVTRLTAGFAGVPPTCQNDPVTFHNQSLGATSYLWDFGDGSPVESQAHPTHQYGSPGAYTVVLTATGPCGTAVTTDTVTVTGVPAPSLQIVPSPAQLGLTTAFTDTGSGGTSWAWSFGDGITASTGVSTTSHVYTGTAGGVTVVLTSTGANGCYSTTSQSLQLDPGPPHTVDLATWPLQPAAGAPTAITVTVADEWGNSVADGTPVTVTAAPPPVVVEPPLATTSGGVALATMTTTLAGPATITATAPNGVDGATEVQVTHAPTASLAVLSPDPYVVGAGGQVAYTLLVTDVHGNGWDATASGTYTVTPAAGGSWMDNVYTTDVTGTWAVTATVPQVTATAILTVTGRPVASFVRQPAGLACVDATIRFTDTSSGPPTAWVWDFDDGVTATVQHPTHTYASAGSYAVVLTATNAEGSDVVSQTIPVGARPTASFTRSPTGDVVAGATIWFTDTSSGSPTAWSWAFGDGITSSLQHPTHVYTAAGSYTATLQVTGDCGSDTFTETITALPACVGPSITDLTSDSPQDQGQTMHFTATVTGDSPITYTWNFGDGTAAETGVGLATPNHVYTASGSFTVTLAVTNSCGSDSQNLPVSVNSLAGIPDHLTLVAEPASLPISQTALLTATLYDVFDTPLAGQVITFTCLDPLGGGGIGPVTATTDAAGQATSAISSTLTGIKLVIATAPNLVNGATNVTFQSALGHLVYLPLTARNVKGPEYPALTLVAEPASLFVNQTSILTATILDETGDPAAGWPVTFSTSSPLGTGGLTPFNAVADSAGQVTATLRSTLEGTVEVRAESNQALSSTVSVVFDPLPEQSFHLTADPLALMVGANATLTATAWDEYGAPAAGLAVTFTTASPLGDGGLVPPASTTNGDGQAVATVSSTLEGLVVVHAQASNGLTRSIGIYFGTTGICAPRQVATVTTGLQPQAIAMDTAGRRAFVAHASGVTVVDLDSLAVIAEMGSLPSGQGVAYDPDNDRLWVTLKGSDRVVVLDGASYAQLANLPTGDGPHGVAYNPANGRVYVANTGSSTVSVYDAEGISFDRTLANFSAPMHLAVNPVTNKIYVVNHTLHGQVTAIDGATHATYHVYANLFDAYGITIDTTRNLVYVASIGEGRLSVIDGASDTFSDHLHIRPGPLTQVPLYTIAVNPDGGNDGESHLFLTGRSQSEGYSKLLLVPMSADGWPPAADKPSQIDVSPYPLNGLAVDPVTDRVWASNLDTGTVSVIQDGPTVCPGWEEVTIDVFSARQGSVGRGLTLIGARRR